VALLGSQLVKCLAIIPDMAVQNIEQYLTEVLKHTPYSNTKEKYFLFASEESRRW